MVGLWTTGSLGTIIALNQPTLLGDGRCQTGDPMLGDYGCGELSTVHGMSAFVTTTLYTASQIFNLTTGPDKEGSTLNRVFTWIHRAGFMALPLLGILSRYPQVIGVDERDFSRGLRSIHVGLGYITALSYTITFSLD